MYTSYCDRITILHKFAQRRRFFDPASREDLLEVKFFKNNTKWKTICPFYLEWPFPDIITMCDSKYSDYMLSKLK